MDIEYSFFYAEHPFNVFRAFARGLQDQITPYSSTSAGSNSFFIGSEKHKSALDDNHFFLNPDVLVSPNHIGQQQMLYDMILRHQDFYDDYKTVYLLLFHLLKDKKEDYFNKDYQEYLNKIIEDQHASLFNLIGHLKEKIIQSPRKSSDIEDKKVFFDLEQVDLEDRWIDELLCACYFYHIALEKIYFNYLGLIDDPVLDTLCNQGVVLTILMVHRMEAVFEKIKECPNNKYMSLAVTWDLLASDLDKRKLFISTKPYRSGYDYLNLCRLFIFRLRRFLINFNIFAASSVLTYLLLNVDPWFILGFQWFNFLFFLPRLILHFSCAAQHIFFPENEEKNIPMSIRATAQFNRRWEIIFRDSLWFFNASMNLFVLTGPWAIYSFQLNIVLQLIETILNYMNLQALGQRLDNRERVSYIFENHMNVEHPYTHNLENCRKDIQDRHAVLYTSLKNRFILSTGILLGNILLLPSLATYTPFIPLLGAGLGLLMNVCQFYNRSWIEFDNDRLRKKPIFETKVKFTSLNPRINNKSISRKVLSNHMMSIP